MNRVTIAVDLAKSVFEIAVTNRAYRITQRRRVSRTQFERFWAEQEPCRVVMEACASAHFWARHLVGLGFEVVLLPPHYVRPYVRRNKTDRTDCEALLEALRCAGIHPVSIRSEEQQAIAALHTVRSQWMSTRNARINTLRALLHEFGLGSPSGSARLLKELPAHLEQHRARLPERVGRMALLLWEEAVEMEKRIEQIEDELKHVARDEPLLRMLLQIPGVGVLTATALYASVGQIHTFKSGRQLASWLGLTPRESSSGGRRRLGRISKQGNRYLRVLLIHGARSALLAAQRKQKAGKSLTRLQAWALERVRMGHVNQAVVALANKMARVIWAVWRHERAFDGDYVPQAA